MNVNEWKQRVSIAVYEDALSIDKARNKQRGSRPIYIVYKSL